jgi:deoxyribonuclease IV
MQRKIGAHVSVAGGFDFAINRANAIGANCAQIFSGSPRVWARRDLSEISVEKMFSKRKELSVEPIFTHAIYLVNLVSENSEIHTKSANILKYDLKFDSMIKGAGVIVHLGSHQGRGWEAVKERLAEIVIKILQETPEDSTFLIENSAGQKGKLCSDFSEIRWLIDRVGETYKKTNRLGWCFDTCHAHSAGYSLSKVSNSLVLPSAVEEITRLKLWSELKCIHVNDSRDKFDSGRDRHENLGKGEIPTKDMKYFLQHKEVKNIPLIIEVPGLDGKGPDSANIEYLKNLVGTG